MEKAYLQLAKKWENHANRQVKTQYADTEEGRILRATDRAKESYLLECATELRTLVNLIGEVE